LYKCALQDFQPHPRQSSPKRTLSFSPASKPKQPEDKKTEKDKAIGKKEARKAEKNRPCEEKKALGKP
jgi:hypothetical protein